MIFRARGHLFTPDPPEAYAGMVVVAYDVDSEREVKRVVHKAEMIIHLPFGLLTPATSSS